MRLTGVYFDLTDRFVSRAVAQRRPVEQHRLRDAELAEAIPSTISSRILISVAKRLVPSAVQRNTVKRIVREAWRAAIRNAAPVEAPPEKSSSQQTDSVVARQGPGSVHGSDRLGPGSPSKGSSRVCLVRLKRFPGDRQTGARKAGAGKAKAGKAEAGSKPGAAVIRRGLRNDVNDLFAAFLAAPDPSCRSRRSTRASDNRRTHGARA